MKVKYFDLFDDTVVEMLMLTFDILVCDLKLLFAANIVQLINLHHQID